MSLCLHFLTMVKLHHFSCSITSSLTSESQTIVTDYGSHFQKQMIGELRTKLDFHHENSSPYCPRFNGQVEAIKKFLKIMLQCMVGVNKISWHLKLFSSLWAYQTWVKTTTGFTSFQLVYGLEAILSIECDIPSMKLTVEILPHTYVE
jgi:hypothetical protein